MTVAGWTGERGQCVDLCCAAGTSQGNLSEPRRRILDIDRVTTWRVYVTAGAKQAPVVKEEDLLTKAGSQANPVKVSKAPVY
eukprot:2374955-Pyramimonas_sp.AAC.1